MWLTDFVGEVSMSYLLFIICGRALMLFAVKAGADSIDNTTWLCLAILTAGEVISWRCKK
jgi:hypothetical protein